VLTHIHPSRLRFTCRTRPVFNGAVCPSSESGAAQGPPDVQSSFARTRRYLARRGVSHPVRGRYPSFIAPTSSCARPHCSPWLRLSLFHGVFAGCRQSLLQDGPSRRYLRNSFPRCLDPYPGAPPGAHTRYFPGDIGLRLLITGSATSNDPYSDFRTGTISGLQSFVHLQASGFACHPDRSYRRVSTDSGQPWRLRPSISRVVTSPCPGYASRPNRAIGGVGTSTPLDLRPCRPLLPGAYLARLASPEWPKY
jgi:hypothetical protein